MLLSYNMVRIIEKLCSNVSGLISTIRNTCIPRDDNFPSIDLSGKWYKNGPLHLWQFKQYNLYKPYILIVTFLDEPNNKEYKVPVFFSSDFSTAINEKVILYQGLRIEIYVRYLQLHRCRHG